MTKDTDRKNLHELLAAISKASTSEAVMNYLKEHRNRAIASELAYKALEASEGRSTLEDIANTYAKFEHHELKEENQFVSDELDQLYNTQVGTPGLRWRLNWLNKSLGSLRKGDFGFIFARPETGKTTFLASEVSYFATQTDRPILWLNNEEGGSKVMIRCYQAALGLTSKELFSDISTNKELFLNLTGGRIKLFDDASMTSRTVEALCKQLQPSLIVIDQLDKIKGFPEDREDLKLGAIYQWGRELAKDYCPIIAVSQADGQGEGVKWLNMGHVANAKTAKQAEADFILGIGKSNDEGMGDIRFLNISKNKLIGDEDSNPALRHGRAEVLILPDIARYKDL
jgi:replicative DNA helicase